MCFKVFKIFHWYFVFFILKYFWGDFMERFSITFDDFKKFLLASLGTFIVSAALHLFLIPFNLAVGGASGFAIVLSAIFPNIPISLTLLVINIALLILGFITIGKEFGAFTVYCSVFMSVSLAFLEKVYPMTSPFTDDLLINLIFGIFIQGIGMSVVLNSGASTGGSDIVAKIIEKYTRFSFGGGLAFTDGIITLLAFIVYGAKLGMYALLGVLVNSLIIDKMIQGFNSKFNITIISDKIDEINDYILVDLFRGSTIYIAEGGYTKNNKRILTTVVDRADYISLKNYIKNIDPNAFVFVSTISEVEGRGFTYETKAELKKQKRQGN